MKRTCRQCKVEKNLTNLHFRDGENKGVHYFTTICRKCWNLNEIKKRKERRNVIKPSKGMHYIRQAVIGCKEEPYFIGEDFEYKAPTYEQILKEYEIR